MTEVFPHLQRQTHQRLLAVNQIRNEEIKADDLLTPQAHQEVDIGELETLLDDMELEEYMEVNGITPEELDALEKEAKAVQEANEIVAAMDEQDWEEYFRDDCVN